MRIKVTRWRWGEWLCFSEPVARVTKTMIVVRWGNGEQRFNRRHGRVAGHVIHGLSGMTDPYIDHEELHRFEAALGG